MQSKKNIKNMVAMIVNMNVKGRHIRVRPPTIDGKTSLLNYLNQFEVVARTNGSTAKEKAVPFTWRSHRCSANFVTGRNRRLR